MPTHRGVTLTLHSHLDMLPLPEYPLPPPSPSPSLPCPPPSPSALPTTPSTSAPHILTPSLPGSHFWLSYAVAPPVPRSQFFVFKMRVDGRAVVSWCSEEQEGHAGKVVCGLFDGGDGGVERRAFRFRMRGDGERDGEEEDGGVVEVDVFRAGGRRRVARRVERWEDGDEGARGGVELVPAGRAGREVPKRFYEFALIDPVDQPYAHFRFYYRSWEQLERMEALCAGADAQLGEENELPVIEPGLSEGEEDEGNEKIVQEEEICSRSPSKKPRNSVRLSTHNGQPETNDPLGANTAHCAPDDSLDDITPLLSSARNSVRNSVRNSYPNSARNSQAHLYRLSFPPTITLNPTNYDSDALPSIPCKNDSGSSTAYRPHPAYPVEEWRLRTPSPVQSVRDGLRTPPLKKKGILSTLKGWGRNISGASSREGRYDEGRG